MLLIDEMKSSDHEDPTEDKSDDSFIMNDGEDDAGPYAMLLMIVLALTYQFHITVQSEYHKQHCNHRVASQM